MRSNMSVLPPLVFDGPEGRVTAAGPAVELVFAVSNRSAETQSAVLHVFGDPLRERFEWALAPGAVTQATLRVSADGARMRRVLARWEQDGRTAREHEVFAIFAPPIEHLATRPGVRVTADSAFSGYTTIPLHDGVIETAGLIWYDAAFASAESAEPHWIRVEFPQPTTVASVTAHWNAEGGTMYASRKGEVWGRLPDGEMVRLGGFDAPQTGATTRISFAPREVKAIEWRQPASGGAAARPDLLWMVELEVQ